MLEEKNPKMNRVAAPRAVFLYSFPRHLELSFDEIVYRNLYGGISIPSFFYKLFMSEKVFIRRFFICFLFVSVCIMSACSLNGILNIVFFY